MADGAPYTSKLAAVNDMNSRFIGAATACGAPPAKLIQVHDSLLAVRPPTDESMRCGPVGFSAGSTLVRRALDAEAAARRRSRCARGAAFNAVLLLALAADLSCKCEGYTTALHWVELAVAGVAGANLLRLALALARSAPSLPALGPDQCRLLGLSAASATTSSFRVEDRSFAESPSSASQSSFASASDSLSLSLSPARQWRSSGAQPSSPAPTPPDSSPEPPRDRFIADRGSLAEYLRDYEDRRRESSPPLAPTWGPVSAPTYQLAATEAESRAMEETAADSALASAWARLHLDPQRLTEFNLNLRIWLHVTILERLVREMASVDAALARGGLGAALGEVAAERLRALSRAPHAPPSLAQLLPFLEPFANQRYIVKRIRTLASGGALSEYKWNGGGVGWDESEPTDAELVLHLFATYLDLQLPGAAPGLRPFSSKHVSSAPAAPPRDLAIHRVSAKPPHYVLVLQGETFEVSRGRNNLLHTLLVLVAALARADPPALRRLHLGRAGLNVLWLIGR